MVRQRRPVRGWILVGMAIGVGSAFAARAEQGPPDGGTAPVVVVPVEPPDSGTVLAGDGAADGGSDAPVAELPGEADAGEQVILLIPAKPPPPPEPPRQLRVTVMHQPRPRVEWSQAAVELGISTGVFVLGSAALVAVELVPIIIAELLSARDVSNAMLKIFSVGNAIALPFATTIAIEKTKMYSRHYHLEGLGWWATYGSGLLLQLISAGVTALTVDVNNYFSATHLVVFGALTPVAQTTVANVLATPRDPYAPLEGSARAPVLLDGNGRPVRVVNVLTVTF